MDHVLEKTPSILGLLGAVYIVAWAGRSGPVMHSDSYRYFEAATLITDGETLVTREFALLYFPPFYPVLLGATVTIFGVSLARAAVLLGAAIFGLNLYVAGATLRRVTGSPAAGAVAALVLFASARFRLDHLEALSDPLFTLLCQTCILALVTYQRSPSRSSMAVAAVAAGLSGFTRLIGYVTMIAAAVMLWRRAASVHPTRDRWREWVGIAALMGISMLPNVAWHGRNLFVHGVVAGGDMRDNELTAIDSLTHLVSHTGQYWSLSTNASPLHAPMAIALLIVAAVGARRAGPPAAAVATFWVFAAAYSVGLVASASALNAIWRSEYAQPLFVMLNSLVLASIASWRGHDRTH